VLEQYHHLEEVRALLGHARIDTTQVYTTIRPPQLKRAVAFYEEKAEEVLGRARMGSRNIRMLLEPGAENLNEFTLVAPTGFEPVFAVRHARSQSDRLVARC
jgi:hypothetical protein